MYFDYLNKLCAMVYSILAFEIVSNSKYLNYYSAPICKCSIYYLYICFKYLVKQL